MKFIKKIFLFSILGFCTVFGSLSFVNCFDTVKTDPAVAFLNSLTAAQKEKTVFKFKDLFREEWHFFPVAMLGRPGLALADMDEKQQSLFFDLLKSYLSESGYKKTRDIMALETIVGEIENNPKFRNPELYLVAIYGMPGDEQWCWSFEGHHVSLNFTIVNNKISMVPRFLGANPGEVREGKHKGLRVLDQEEDLAFELLHSLSKEQKKIAIFQDYSYWELVSSTSSQVSPLTPVGIKYQSLTEQQKAKLFEIILVYLATMPDQLADERLKKLQSEDLDDIRFGWAGSTDIKKPHYYRIQGKTFLIEFDNSQNDANHVHTIWRDFEGDFGRDLIRAHREAHEH